MTAGLPAAAWDPSAHALLLTHRHVSVSCACVWFQEWTWSLVSGESVDVECLVLEHSSEVSCIGWQVPLNLLTEARVISRPQVGVTLSWPIHLLKPKQTHTELEWW